MPSPKKKMENKGFFSSMTSSLSVFSNAMHRSVNGFIGYENLEVVNPEGGKDDAEEEAQRGRWKQEERDNYWKMMQKYIGSDVTSMVTLPVIIFEPMSMLQKMAEIMEYSYLLDQADECEDPYLRLVYAASWAISVYYALQRTWKPFNPILGETYEMINHNGITFLSEQVSHHPPMSAGHCENEHFTYDLTSKLKTKFLGNSLDVYPIGRKINFFLLVLDECYSTRASGDKKMVVLAQCGSDVVCFLPRSGDFISWPLMNRVVLASMMAVQFCFYLYSKTRVTLKSSGVVLDLVPPPTKVHNLIFGRTWVDSPGEMILSNLTTGDKVVLYFQPCGWFGAGRYEVDGYVYDANEEPKILMTGKWNESMSYQQCDVEGEPLPSTEPKEAWHLADTPKNDKYQYTYFAHKINSFDTAPKNLLASDSRLRPDRYALELGDLSKSGAEKSSLEERQRAEKRNREAKGDKFSPRWFDLTEDVATTPWGDMEIYQYNGKYTEHRAAIYSSDIVELEDVKTKEFNPWQYSDLSGV